MFIVLCKEHVTYLMEIFEVITEMIRIRIIKITNIMILFRMTDPFRLIT